MLNDNTLIKVTNRDNGSVGYTIPDLGNLRRDFQSGETKEITMNEIRKLSYIPGGFTLLEDYLIIHNEEAVKEILGEVEPEYHYAEPEIRDLLLFGSLDALKDCLDFAPEGTVNLVKKLAVDLKINDISKRQAILEATGFNVNSAVMVNEATSEEEAPVQKQRRTATEQPATAGRRSKYTIVSSQK